MRWRSTGEASEEEPVYHLSISDLMSALIFVFILLLVVLLRQAASERTEAEQERRALIAEKEALSPVPEMRRRLLQELVRELAEEDLRGQDVKDVKRPDAWESVQGLDADYWYDMDQAVLHFSAEKLGFAVGEADVNQTGRRTLETVGGVLGRVLPDYLGGPISPASGWRRAEVDVVLVEGHTDNQKLSKPASIRRFKDNWGLSAQRALNAWDVLRRDTPTTGLDSLRNSRKHPLFSVAGYAFSRPVDPEQPALNRRIDFRFIMIPAESLSVAASVRDRVDGGLDP